MKTSFHDKNFALSLAFIMRFKATRKWSIQIFLLENHAFFSRCIKSCLVTRSPILAPLFTDVVSELNLIVRKGAIATHSVAVGEEKFLGISS